MPTITIKNSSGTTVKTYRTTSSKPASPYLLVGTGYIPLGTDVNCAGSTPRMKAGSYYLYEKKYLETTTMLNTTLVLDQVIKKSVSWGTNTFEIQMNHFISNGIYLYTLNINCSGSTPSSATYLVADSAGSRSVSANLSSGWIRYTGTTTRDAGARIITVIIKGTTKI